MAFWISRKILIINFILYLTLIQKNRVLSRMCLWKNKGTSSNNEFGVIC